MHWGATTQDVMDTSLVLQLRDAFALLEIDLEGLVRALAERAERHRSDVMAGRTHLQHALPMTFGYKCAVWLAPLCEALVSLRSAREAALVVQFGGAVGTLASLGDQGRAVTLALRRGTRLGSARCAVAFRPLETRRERKRLRDRVRERGEICDRRRVADADGSRRGLRAARTRTRRVEYDAAEAQPDRERVRDRGRARRADPRPARARSDGRRPRTVDGGRGRAKRSRSRRSSCSRRRRSRRRVRSPKG